MIPDMARESLSHFANPPKLAYYHVNCPRAFNSEGSSAA